ncbi:MAG: zinc ABC transporter ATP-binding protein AztA [Oleiphilaceae bacterium]|nr:zinc ABC transporter ATP-binding protein AztA [Oleiphilaceae bacterium]
MTDLLELRNLTLGYDLHPAVHHVSMSVQRGDLMAIIGPNGAGKSTLLKALVGQIQPLSGEIIRHGLSKERIAYLPQLSQVDRTFPITVHEMVSLGAWTQTGPFGRVRSKDRRKVSDAIVQLGLEGFEQRLIGSLSGGQMQRVLFARLLVQKADLILLDEPFTGIDSRTTADLLALIHAWHRHGKTVLAVLHDFDQVRRHFPRCLLLSRQAIAVGATESVMTPLNLQRARRLNEAFDERAEYCAHD